ncbi:hypothetical protein PR048_026382 [Dryococelus australis]|uniref:Uncharacterized protein n=1 Tax=Dryococelus australis TaxID=614101 RepID=A0ABQ9GL55_9NEOP|nr:hypothetical protein PR048_026382 [Dryococelus australis]
MVTLQQNTLFVGVVNVLQLLFRTVNCGLEKCHITLPLRGREAAGSNVALARHMIDLHVKLCEVVDKVNSTYGLQVVLWLLAAFLAISSITYGALLIS